MAGLEASLVIRAVDEAGGAFAALKKQIESLSLSIAAVDKAAGSIGKVRTATEPMAASLNAASMALKEQRAALIDVSAGLARVEDTASLAAHGQARLASATERTTAMLIRQANEAVMTADRVAASQRKVATATPVRPVTLGKQIADVAPFAGPAILHGTMEAIKAGATWQEEVTRIKAAGGSDADIAKAREDFREFAKTHSGATEAEYLAGYRAARVIAPHEAYDMATLGARYRIAARNSGLNLSEYDVENVMRIVDELGLPDEKSREEFIGNHLKAQQAFGSQINSETALAAYRNAKQSIYSWSPEFRDYVFPTLLQSSGEQGGTQMMTALNNYVGGHMTHAELKSLVAAGFVNNKDLVYNKVGDVKGLKPGAKLFEAEKFKSNIFEWATDFHDTYMQRKGATEEGFDDLIAKMPRNMAGLIAFLQHNRQRIPRDAANIKASVGLVAEGDDWLAKNPVAGMEALKTSIEQFAATVTGPTMEKIGANLQSMAAGIQAVGSAVEKFNIQNPGPATAVGFGAIGAGLGTGVWLLGKLFGNIRSFFGGGAAGGAAEGAEGGAAAGARPARLPRRS